VEASGFNGAFTQLAEMRGSANADNGFRACSQRPQTTVYAMKCQPMWAQCGRGVGLSLVFVATAGLATLQAAIPDPRASATQVPGITEELVARVPVDTRSGDDGGTGC